MLAIVKQAGLLALLAPSLLVAALPRVEVPWKRDGISGRDSSHFSEVSDIHLRDSTCKNAARTRSCWSNGYSVSTDMDLKWPTTGVTRTYTLTITNVTNFAPDGFGRPMMLINNQYPGPVITADWGDTLSITVINQLENNGTSIHWHGLRQLHSNQMDGTNGLTECPIAPGQTKTYTFQATQYGTSWYHSHYSVQYAEGIVGTIQINGPATANYDIDLGPLPITDWFHTPAFTVNAAALHAGGPPTSDNILVNGSMTSSSGGAYAKTTLTPGKKHLLRIVNTGINQFLHVSLDSHPFTVIAADFVPIVPYTTTSIVLGVGQRYDVIINANNTVANYWLRVGTGGGQCDGPNANAANIRSIFSYVGAPAGNPNSSGITLPTGCGDETNVVPYVKTNVPSQLPKKLGLTFSQTAAKNNLVQWLINSTAILIDWEKPTLQYVIDGNTSFPATDNVYTVGAGWQYWMIQAAADDPPLPHPIHLHGHDFYVLGQGSGQWGGDVSTLSLTNPIRRDTATLPANGYLILAFESDNPGAWLMHCHIPFHISAGLGLQFLERESEILGSIGSLDDFKNGCKSWDTYENSITAFDMGDSGLKRRSEPMSMLIDAPRS
ncbi:hypothetical protein BU16DRAFT_105279 [Lophium mytilinum]|uniref:Laccase n=1 Tax=Lophium mytilinum TaxID=390894 RepID=A0A6A6QI95_9PEZI|nr:hypothetical protein BU16DRAFT_105279 [Lophium mytilinum]